MPAWLATLLTDLLIKLGSIIGKDFEGWLAKRKAQKANADAAKKSVEPLENATTAKEVRDATDSALGL